MAGGGTGGHVIPALAVARELRQRGHEAVFVGTERGLEAKLVPAEGFELQRIDIGGLNRVGCGRRSPLWRKLPFTTLGCGKFVRQACRGLQHGRIRGRAAGDGRAAAAQVPVVVMEPNAVPGLHQSRHRPLRGARADHLSGDRRAIFPTGRTEITGLPVREEFFRIPPKPRGEALHVLITGGSQGSRTLNQAARQSWPLFRKAGLAGAHRPPDRRARLRGTARGVRANPAWKAKLCRSSPICRRPSRQADLIVCRSGAGAVSELAAAGKPSILVPFPFAADDHQTRNAEAIERGGAARLVRDAEMTGEKLFAAVTELAGDPEALEAHGRRRRGSSRSPGAARRAAEILEEVARA